MNRTRRQELVSSFTHGGAGLLAIAGLVMLIVLSASQKTPWHVVGFSIYGTSLILLYTASFIYHLFNAVKGFKESWQSLDYAMITILIAGTYTPVTLVSLRGGWGWTLFGIIWGMTIASIVLRQTTSIFKRWVPPIYYLIMGWLILIAIVPLANALPAPALWLLFGGGACYTLGVGFYVLEGKIKLSTHFGMHEVFHIFVILGSVCHFIMMYKYI